MLRAGARNGVVTGFREGLVVAQTRAHPQSAMQVRTEEVPEMSTRATRVTAWVVFFGAAACWVPGFVLELEAGQATTTPSGNRALDLLLDALGSRCCSRCWHFRWSGS